MPRRRPAPLFVLLFWGVPLSFRSAQILVAEAATHRLRRNAATSTTPAQRPGASTLHIGRRGWLALASGLALLILAAGCGGGDSGGSVLGSGKFGQPLTVSDGGFTFTEAFSTRFTQTPVGLAGRSAPDGEHYLDGEISVTNIATDRSAPWAPDQMTLPFYAQSGTCPEPFTTPESGQVSNVCQDKSEQVQAVDLNKHYPVSFDAVGPGKSVVAGVEVGPVPDSLISTLVVGCTTGTACQQAVAISGS